MEILDTRAEWWIAGLTSRAIVLRRLDFLGQKHGPELLRSGTNTVLFLVSVKIGLEESTCCCVARARPWFCWCHEHSEVSLDVIGAVCWVSRRSNPLDEFDRSYQPKKIHAGRSHIGLLSFGFP